MTFLHLTGRSASGRLLLAVAVAACGRSPESSNTITKVGLEQLPAGTASYDPIHSELVLELPPIDVPAGGMIVTPASRVDIPVSGFVHSARAEVVDAQGRVQPPALLHHFNVIDPGRRELFVPLALRLYAASKETGSAAVPQRLIGMPLIAGQRILLKAMLHDPENTAPRGVRARVVLGYAPGGAWWPLYHAFPMQLDVMHPVGGPEGEKSFDLPPGHFEKSYQARPAISGTLIGIGGHVHDFAEYLEFRDVTASQVLWRGIPYLDDEGSVSAMPIGRLYRWYRLGIRLDATHSYEVHVVYDNPTADTLKYGGMGVVGGLFVPDRNAKWPGVDTTDAAYREDLAAQLRDGNTVGEMALMMHEHHTRNPSRGTSQGQATGSHEHRSQHQHGPGHHH